MNFLLRATFGSPYIIRPKLGEFVQYQEKILCLLFLIKPSYVPSENRATWVNWGSSFGHGGGSILIIPSGAVGPHEKKWFCVGDCLKGNGQCTLILFGLTWYQAQITSTNIMHDIRRYDMEALISELPTIILFAIFIKVLQISNNVKRMRENGEEKTIESWTYPLKMVK